MGHSARNPRRTRGWQQAQLLRQGNARAALAGKQQLPTLMLMQARIVITEGGGDADDRRGETVGIEMCVGVEPGHGLSDFSDKLAGF
ncbi:hypothetical protein D3C78_1537520 [compost metagenome]